jgi:hypothetical protein
MTEGLIKPFTYVFPNPALHDAVADPASGKMVSHVQWGVAGGSTQLVMLGGTIAVPGNITEISAFARASVDVDESCWAALLGGSSVQSSAVLEVAVLDEGGTTLDAAAHGGARNGVPLRSFDAWIGPHGTPGRITIPVGLGFPGPVRFAPVPHDRELRISFAIFSAVWTMGIAGGRADLSATLESIEYKY